MPNHTVGTYDVQKEIRNIRKKHYEETKNRSMAERKEFDCRINEEIQKELSKIELVMENILFRFYSIPKPTKTQLNQVPTTFRVDKNFNNFYYFRYKI
ncbi:MAG: hypothetical protein LBC02_12350 [Planctomycetaceae bacterium]|jgi:hypothetical protein|nr:hypothetical protein [Planctomycetaceae bacterium]